MQPSSRSTWILRTAVGLSLLAAALFVLTMIEPQWIERLIGESPDAGDGSFERLIVGTCCAVASAGAAALAWRERRRARTRAAAPAQGRDRTVSPTSH